MDADAVRSWKHDLSLELVDFVVLRCWTAVVVAPVQEPGVRR